MARLRVLICAMEPPVSPLNGFRLQLRELCAGLARRHELCVLAFDPGASGGQMPAGIELETIALPRAGPAARVRASAEALVRRRPRRVGMVTRPMAEALTRMLAEREVDLVQVSGPQLAGVAPVLGSTPSVLAALDAWHLNAAAETRMAPVLMRPLHRIEERNVRRFSATAFGRFGRVVVVSEADAEALADLDPALAVAAVPNGVDAEHLAPNPEVPAGEGLIVFTGAMHWAPNVDAARFLAIRVLPLLRARDPRARLAIVGRNPRSDVEELAALENVEVTGAVADIRPWLWRAQAFACPMISGTGIKNKLLEALACGTPCVATSLSCQGIRVDPGRDLLIAESAGEFAAALARVLADASLRARLSSGGRRVAQRQSWAATVQGYEAVYDEVLAEAGADTEVATGRRRAQD